MDEKKIAIKPLIFDVQKLTKKVDLVGEFSLQEKIDTQIVNQYENINLLYKLQGIGYDNKAITLLPKIANVTTFFENDSTPAKLTKEGFKIKKRFIYSLNAKKDFTIPSVKIKVFSPKTKRYYTLSTSSYTIKVKQIPISTLLDKEEYPKTKSFISFHIFQQLFIYIFIFSLGFLTAKLSQNRVTKQQKRKEFQDIQKSTTPKNLIILLLNRYSDRELEYFIKKLELLEYKKRGDFKKIKKTIIHYLKN